MNTFYFDRESFTLYAGAMPMLLMLLVWLFFCWLFIRSRDWQTKIVGWALLVAPIIRLLMDSNL